MDLSTAVLAEFPFRLDRDAKTTCVACFAPSSDDLLLPLPFPVASLAFASEMTARENGKE